MCRAAFVVDVCAVGFIVDDAQARAQIQHCQRGSLIGSAVCTVQCNLDAAEFFCCCFCQEGQIIIQRFFCVTLRAQTDACRGRQDLGAAHQDIFDLVFQFIAQFIALFVEEFDAVVFYGVMGCGDHNAGIQSVFSYQICNCRCGDHAGNHCMGAYGADACHQCAFQHITADTCIHRYQNTGCVFLFLCQHICAGSAQSERQIACQFCIGNASYTVCTK